MQLEPENNKNVKVSYIAPHYRYGYLPQNYMSDYRAAH